MTSTPNPPSHPAAERLRAQIAQLDTLAAEGVLTVEAAAAARRPLLQQLGELGELGEGTAPVAPLVRPSRGLVAMVAAFVLAVGAVGYAVKGQHAGWSVGPGDSGAEAGEAAQLAQVNEMVSRLEARLKTAPDDADGWTMLARSYGVQGRFAEAVPAWRRVVALRPKDGQALADYADALAMANGRNLEGEPEKLALQAVQLDPSNVKALVLAGTAAFNRKDAAAAAALWEKALAVSDPAAEFTTQLRAGVDEARQRAGLPPLPAAAPASAPATATATATAAAPAASATIAGRVTLSAAARAAASPDDVVFIFARAPAGSRMPLAILRKKVSDLPLDFQLDDSLAMSPAARLSGAPQVIVGARLSKSGTATPGPGDWQVLSEPVALGASGLKLEIGEPLR
jgi:cytochrome c-type biogenesis protein CcmH